MGTAKNPTAVCRFIALWDLSSLFNCKKNVIAPG